MKNTYNHIGLGRFSMQMCEFSRAKTYSLLVDTVKNGLIIGLMALGLLVAMAQMARADMDTKPVSLKNYLAAYKAAKGQTASSAPLAPADTAAAPIAAQAAEPAKAPIQAAAAEPAPAKIQAPIAQAPTQQAQAEPAPQAAPKAKIEAEALPAPQPLPLPAPMPAAVKSAPRPAPVLRDASITKPLHNPYAQAIRMNRNQLIRAGQKQIAEIAPSPVRINASGQMVLGTSVGSE